jgi:hypothetical protein
MLIMSNVSSHRFFPVNFGCDIFCPDEWIFDSNGEMVEAEKEKFFLSWGEYESKEETLKRLEEYEGKAKLEIAETIDKEARIKAQLRAETEAERKAKWMESRKSETEEYLYRTADIKEALFNRMNN